MKTINEAIQEIEKEKEQLIKDLEKADEKIELLKSLEKQEIKHLERLERMPLTTETKQFAKIQTGSNPEILLTGIRHMYRQGEVFTVDDAVVLAKESNLTSKQKNFRHMVSSLLKSLIRSGEIINRTYNSKKGTTKYKGQYINQRSGLKK